MTRRDLAAQVVRGCREYSIGVVLFHQAVGQVLRVNVSDMKCLDVMTLKGTASPSELAKYTGLSTGATTAMIDRLEKAKLIERRPHLTDRRGTTLVLTKHAMQTLPAMFGSLANAMELLVLGYSERELKILADFFAKVGVLWREEREKLQGAHVGRPPAEGVRGSVSSGLRRKTERRRMRANHALQPDGPQAARR
jgi:DNA-binding MarR family transcriptional regulator